MRLSRLTKNFPTKGGASRAKLIAREQRDEGERRKCWHSTEYVTDVVSFGPGERAASPLREQTLATLSRVGLRDESFSLHSSTHVSQR